MNSGKLVILWFTVVVASGCFGFIAGHQDAVKTGSEACSRQIEYEETLYWGGIGFGAATPLAAGIHVIQKVRGKRSRRGLALLTMAVSSLASMFLPLLVGSLSGLFHGEIGQVMWGFEFMLLSCIGLLSFVSFGTAIICVRQR